MRAAGDHADRAAIGEAHPRFPELAPGARLSATVTDAPRIELQHAMPERRGRIGSIERDRSPRQDAPDGPPVRDDQVCSRSADRVARARVARSALSVVAVEALRGARHPARPRAPVGSDHAIEAERSCAMASWRRLTLRAWPGSMRDCTRPRAGAAGVSWLRVIDFGRCGVNKINALPAGSGIVQSQRSKEPDA